MQETVFHSLADKSLLSIQDMLEDADRQGALDIDFIPGTLTIRLESGEVYVLNKHAPSLQLWLSSPVSGGLHFSYNDERATWVLPDGRALGALLAQEIAVLSGIIVAL